LRGSLWLCKNVCLIKYELVMSLNFTKDYLNCSKFLFSLKKSLFNENWKLLWDNDVKSFGLGIILRNLHTLLWNWCLLLSDVFKKHQNWRFLVQPIVERLSFILKILNMHLKVTFLKPIQSYKVESYKVTFPLNDLHHFQKYFAQ